MISMDQIHWFETYLDTLLMLQYAHDEGISHSVLSKCDMGGDDSGYSYYDSRFDNFLRISNHLFEIVEVYRNSHEFGENYQENIEYWLQEADANEKFEQHQIVVVIMDLLLNGPITGEIGECFSSGSSGMAYPIENGVVLVFDEDYGEPNWTDTLRTLLDSRRVIARKEELLYEMVI